jgi:hypothetical protein
MPSGTVPLVVLGLFVLAAHRHVAPASPGVVIHGFLQSPDSGPLRFVKTIGSDAGPISFTQIGVAAASASGVLAVVDNGNCQILLLRALTGSLIRKVGRCGDGPGEFRRLGSISFRDDDLLVYDVQRRDLVWIGQDGTEQRRMSIVRLEGSPAGATAVHVLDDTTLVAARYTFPEATPANDFASVRDLIAVVDARTGRLRRTLFPTPDPGWNNLFRLMNHAATCTSGVGDSFRLATMSMWDFGGAVFRGPFLTGPVPFHTTVKWMEPVTTRQAAPGVLPGAVAFNVVCSEMGLLLWAARRDLRVPGHVGTEGRIEFRTYDGRMLWSLDFGKQDSRFHERPIAAFRDRVWFRANNTDGFPHLVEFQILRRAQ